jgi:hypothetical protein
MDYVKAALYTLGILTMVTLYVALLIAGLKPNC